MSIVDNKIQYGSDRVFGDKFNIIWDYAIVVDINDPYEAGRIKVRIPKEDKDTEIAQQLLPPEEGGLPWCEPLLPKYLNVIPEVGQLVKVICFDVLNKKLRRQYVGPVVGQQTPVDFLRSLEFEAKNKVEFSAYTNKWSDNPDASKGDWAIYPSKKDIAFLGRKNSDIIMRGNSNINYDEIQLRVGKIDPTSIELATQSSFLNSPVKLNTKNPGYITLNFTEATKVPLAPSSLALNNSRSHINVVADNINFISHKGSSANKGNTLKLDTIISGDINKQIEVETRKLHPVVYGDVLWEFLELLRAYITGHVHRGAGKTVPDANAVYGNIVQWFNDNMGTQVDVSAPGGVDTYTEIQNCTFLSKGVKTN